MTFVSGMALSWDYGYNADAQTWASDHSGMLEECKTPQPNETTVYTDGACLGNPGPGGWAWAVPGGRWRSGPAARTTNQRMEIMAALDAARSLPGRARDRERQHLRGQLLPGRMVGEVAGEGMGQRGQEAGGEPRPLGTPGRPLPGTPSAACVSGG